MKVCLYEGDMNINRKFENKYVEIQKTDFLGNKTVKKNFLVQMLYNPMGYLASIMFWMPRQYF